jgi:hypothetical protein
MPITESNLTIWTEITYYTTSQENRTTTFRSLLHIQKHYLTFTKFWERWKILNQFDRMKNIFNEAPIVLFKRDKNIYSITNRKFWISK